MGKALGGLKMLSYDNKNNGPMIEGTRTMPKKLAATILTLAALLLVGGAGLLTAQASGDYQVIVHPDNPTDSLDKKTLSRYFLKKTSRWDFGDKPAIKPVDLVPSSKTREAFTVDIHRRKLSAVKSYWQQRIFSGRGVPPPEVAEQDALEFVRSNPEAIAYVSARASTSGVKVLTVTD